LDNLAQKPSLDIRLTYDFLYLILYIVILLFFGHFSEIWVIKRIHSRSRMDEELHPRVGDFR